MPGEINTSNGLTVAGTTYQFARQGDPVVDVRVTESTADHKPGHRLVGISVNLVLDDGSDGGYGAAHGYFQVHESGSLTPGRRWEVAEYAARAVSALARSESSEIEE